MEEVNPHHWLYIIISWNVLDCIIDLGMQLHMNTIIMKTVMKKSDKLRMTDNKKKTPKKPFSVPSRSFFFLPFLDFP